MVSKTYARYQPAPAKNGDHCADCTMFRPPDNCTYVDGHVIAEGWCTRFEEKSNGQAS